MRNRISAVMLFLCLVGCKHAVANLPQGFAPYASGAPWQDFRAVSADGVVFRVRETPNEPVAELAFWKEALKKRMLEAGYTFLSERDIKAAGGEPGYLIELTAPLGDRDYVYLIGVFRNRSHLIIAEAGGDVVTLEKRKKDIVSAMEKTVLQ